MRSKWMGLTKWRDEVCFLRIMTNILMSISRCVEGLQGSHSASNEQARSTCSLSTYQARLYYISEDSVVIACCLD